MFEQLRAIDWSGQSQPQGNAADAIPRAIEALARAGSDEESWRAYDCLLDSLGNNHAGTYYPVVLQVLPFLEQLLLAGPLTVQRRVLDILIDLNGAFVPDQGHSAVTTSDGSSRSLQALVREGISAVLARLHPVLVQSPDAEIRELTEQLADDISDVSQ